MIDEIRYCLQDRNLSIVADTLDINYLKLIRIANGGTKNPSNDVLMKLHLYLGIDNKNKINILKEIAINSAFTGLVLYSVDKVIKGDCTSEEAADYIMSAV